VIGCNDQASIRRHKKPLRVPLGEAGEESIILLHNVVCGDAAAEQTDRNYH
jgi:hypothetical protein